MLLPSLAFISSMLVCGICDMSIFSCNLNVDFTINYGRMCPYMTQLVKHCPPQQHVCFCGEESQSCTEVFKEILIARSNKVAVGVAHVLPIVSWLFKP